MRQMLAALGALAMCTPAFAQTADAPSLSLQVSRLTFEVCAAALERGPDALDAIAEAAEETRGWRVSRENALSALPGDRGVRFARMLGTETSTSVRVVEPPEQAINTFVSSVVRVDTEGCIVVAQGAPDALELVRARLSQATGVWVQDGAQNGAQLFRRIGEGATGRIRLIVAPRRNAAGFDQIILFREAVAGPSE